MGLHVVGIVTLVLYLAASLVFLVGVVRPTLRIVALGPRLMYAGFALHTLLLLFFYLDARLLIPETQGDYYLWVSWILPLSFFVLGKKLNYPIIGAFLAPAISLFLVSSSYLIHKTDSGQLHGNFFLFLFHVLPAIVAEVNLVFAFVVSGVFLLQERRIKKKSIHSLDVKGPSLELLEVLNQRFVLTGFLAMSCAIVTGSIWALGAGRPLLENDLNQWTALVAWALLAFILHSRMSKRWSARELSRITLVASAAVFLSFFLATLLLGNSFHGTPSV